ncbi:BAG family molecular chaperone regulator 4 [Humulus lupulus]|uniref:BAG family molecular chaperone regulator 4 n=1 Tax=Humulus lupulus TaxID=3486 RepID=UPI002B405830|nr:BAG family molecular chaperone regulator 4 [Humulus lupulus]
MMNNTSVPVHNGNGNGDEVDWEMRPGGMLVQMRDDEVDAAGPAAPSRGPMIKINVYHDTAQHELFVPAQSTFGDVKKVLLHKTGLEPNEQKLLFRGKEREDEEHLHVLGVKDNSKVVLLEDHASRERKLEEMKKSREIAKASEAVAQVRAEVDKLSERVDALEVAVIGGTKVEGKEFDVSTELLMRQLLKLDGIKAEGEAKLQRKAEVRRVQKYVDALDTLKGRNANPINSPSNAVSVTTQWETFDNGVGSLNAPPSTQSPTKLKQDWERFD